MNTKFHNAIDRVPQKTPPIWFMRQAGRYHQHYQKLRAQHSFMELCKQPELAAQVALGPIEDFDFDVSILFSDILFPLEGLGLGLEYTDKGPRLGFHINKDNVTQLNPTQQALEFLKFQAQAVQATRQLLPRDKSLIGFIGGPWTLFVYAVEGSHAGSLVKAKSDPQLWRMYLEIMLPLLQENIRIQIEAGAEIVMVFDTAAGEVDPLFFQMWIQPALEKLSQSFPQKLGYYSKGTQAVFFNDSFKQLPWAGMGVDHRWKLPEAFMLREKGFIQGNFDQALLFQETADFKKSMDAYVRPLRELSVDQRAGWVCGLGHGVLPQTPEKHVKLFVQTMREVFS